MSFSIALPVIACQGTFLPSSKGTLSSSSSRHICIIRPGPAAAAAAVLTAAADTVFICFISKHYPRLELHNQLCCAVTPMLSSCKSNLSDHPADKHAHPLPLPFLQNWETSGTGTTRTGGGFQLRARLQLHPTLPSHASTGFAVHRRSSTGTMLLHR